MKKPYEPEKRRDKVITFQVTPREKLEIERRADESRMSVSSYCRFMVWGNKEG